ncbi:hypothetical protein O181_024950 [Austropuccinia psidii MF-1]|uniref:Uncharacterized protein n=1 Tax=Austropuccinia psidii MF-1 TaxID=1389203 RepID=A0A9Q3CLR7_9BASI|nr:hypothetical protein [Austropuccinia psidii MF-1]
MKTKDLWRRALKEILKVLGGNDAKEEGNSVEEEALDVTEAAPVPVEASQGTEGPTLAQNNNPVYNQSEPSLLAIMQQMTHIMVNLQAAPSSEASIQPAFKKPSVKEPDGFEGTKPFKFWSFIQSFHLFFHNDKENFFEKKKNALYSPSFLTGRTAK